MQSTRANLNGVWAIALLALSLTFVSFVIKFLIQKASVHRVTLAAGAATGESYIIGSALKSVVERHNPGIRITVLETGGSVENLNLLEAGRVQLAMAQADVVTGPSARIMAVLYDDTFQLITRRVPPPQNFAELRGQTVALAQSGGQYQSFLRVAHHFGLTPSDFRFVGKNDAEADKAFADGQVDALFRVRALGNPAIQRFVQPGNVRLVPIEHAAAMKIEFPAFQPAVIPAGAYLGNPSVPAQDLPTVSVQRTLLAAASLDEEVVSAITAALIDDRQQVAQAISDRHAEVRRLLAQARRPDVQSQLGPGLHPGALKFYEKDKPSFIQAHSDLIGVLLTALAMLTSWIWQIKSWLERRQKNVADDYSNRAIVLINVARSRTSETDLEADRNELLDLLTAAVADLDSDRLSEQSFDSFRAILEIGLDAVRDRRDLLLTAARKNLHPIAMSSSA